MLDFHNHLIPGVDDGAVSLAQSFDGLRAMRDEGRESRILNDEPPLAVPPLVPGRGWWRRLQKIFR